MTDQDIRAYAKELDRKGDRLGVLLCRVSVGERLFEELNDLDRNAETGTLRQKLWNLGIRGEGGADTAEATIALAELERLRAGEAARG